MTVLRNDFNNSYHEARDRINEIRAIPEKIKTEILLLIITGET